MGCDYLCANDVLREGGVSSVLKRLNWLVFMGILCG